MAIAVDASSQTAFADSGVSGATVTSAAFSPVASSLLVVAFTNENSAASNADSTATITNTGTALTWTQVALANRTTTTGTWNGATCFFWAFNTAAQSGITVTVTPSGTTNFDRQVTVAVITGHDTSAPVGASGVGISTSTATAITYTSTVVGSVGFAAALQLFNIAVPTAGTGTTFQANLHTSSSTDATHAYTTAAAASLATQTLNLTYASAPQVTFSYLEIVPLVTPAQAEGAYNSSAMARMRG